METVGNVCKTIQTFRRLGQYIEGDDYIIGLSKDLRRDKAVTIEAAQLYLVQGHYIKASDACHLVSCPIFKKGDPSADFTLEICDATSVTLALLTSYVGISRHGKLKTALKVADRIYDVWLTPDRMYARFLSVLVKLKCSQSISLRVAFRISYQSRREIVS
jgi:hypothetical protein